MLKKIFFVIGLLLAMQPAVFAGGGGVTPYGDYCKDCTIYGTCKQIITPGDAVNALVRYYRLKGYRVGTIYHKGRFIEAEIFKNNTKVDKVLFDRKTGRLRSIY
jgi:hypothetical protein